MEANIWMMGEGEWMLNGEWVKGRVREGSWNLTGEEKKWRREAETEWWRREGKPVCLNVNVVKRWKRDMGGSLRSDHTVTTNSPATPWNEISLEKMMQKFYSEVSLIAGISVAPFLFVWCGTFDRGCAYLSSKSQRLSHEGKFSRHL